MELLVVAAALWFIYESLKALFALIDMTAKQIQFGLFLYCFIATLILLYSGGFMRWAYH